MKPLSLLRNIGPLVVWLAVIFSMSTDMGSATHTNSKLDAFIAYCFPQLERSLTPTQNEDLHYAVRKAAHVTEYAILGILILRALRFNQSSIARKHLIGAWILATLYAMTDEWHQRSVPSRTSNPHDVMIDSAGAVLGLCLYLWYYRRVALPRRRRLMSAGNAPSSVEA